MTTTEEWELAKKLVDGPAKTLYNDAFDDGFEVAVQCLEKLADGKPFMETSVALGSMKKLLAEMRDELKRGAV